MKNEARGLVHPKLAKAVYALKALIANLLAAKGLTRLRAGLRARVKGLTIIIDLICNLIGLPRSHLLLTRHTHRPNVSPPPRHRDVRLHLSLPVPASIPTLH